MRRVLPLIAVMSLGFVPAPFPKPDLEKADLAKLQGEWEQVSSSLIGRPLCADGGVVEVFSGNRLSYVSNGTMTFKWVVTLDPSKKPKRMDLIDPDMPGHKVLCIYKLDGDTLTFAFCNHGDGLTRPTDFKPHENVGVGVFKRKKR